MGNDEVIVEILMEIRDNQRSQMEWIKSSQMQAMRRVIIALGLVGIGLAILLCVALSK